MKPTLYLFIITISLQMSLGVSLGWAKGTTVPIRMGNTQVTLPISTARFPPGPGVEIANAYCTMCHSADMVTQQPPSLTRKDWQAEVHKMQVTYGAPIPDDQIPPLATYLAATISENHSRNSAECTPVDPAVAQQHDMVSGDNNYSCAPKTTQCNDAMSHVHYAIKNIFGPVIGMTMISDRMPVFRLVACSIANGIQHDGCTPSYIRACF